jgi:alpha-L-fucosidase 2
MKNLLIVCILGLNSITVYAQIENYNVVWESPGPDSWGSMPAGNGDIGANFWVDPDGEIHFLISKTDAFSENGRLLKIGKLKVHSSPNILKNSNFRQELDIDSGTIKITGEKNGQKIELSFWIDANNPVITLNGTSSVPVKVEVEYDGWRNKRRILSKKEERSAYGLMGSPDPIYVEPDIVGAVEDGIMWYHRNERSVWENTLEVQALSEFSDRLTDPLLYRTFGAVVKGNNLKKKSPEKLISEDESTQIYINIFPYTAQTKTADQWRTELLKNVQHVEGQNLEQRKTAHQQWWAGFWEKHHIIVESEKDSAKIYHLTQGYLLQRYMNACSGRGNMPIKFNGSIFTVDMLNPERRNSDVDADYRNWGACYWWQNTRLPYWAMLHSGDFELMKPLFKMYMDALKLAMFRTEKYYKHKGAMFPETMYFWGTWNNNNYGWNRKGKPDGLSDNKYIRYEWQGGIELLYMMLDYYSFTGDTSFLNNTMIPFSKEILTFYDLHYRRDENGKIRFDPAQALETYWEGTINPMPEIAGLKAVLNGLLQYEHTIADKNLMNLCHKLQNEIPGMPATEIGGKKVLTPAESYGESRNVENPELYAVFPYRHYGVDKPELEMARETWFNRKWKDYFGWQQDGIQAALLGLTDEASEIVVDNFNTKHSGSRFPAFWGPNYDWVPDQDHGAVNMRALQNMLIQTEGVKIILFPAWPKHWNVNFKIHAPMNTTIEGKLENSKLIYMKVTPEHRKKDIINYLDHL